MRKVLVIVGPTAAGKSRLGMTLAEGRGGEIINADALQAYRGFDLGTAKPSPRDLERVPHHLIDILDPDERYSAGDFSRRARSAIRKIRDRGRLPILVGGSGLYLRAALEGLSPIPEPDPEVREQLGERLEEEGLECLRRQLERLDPITAQRLTPADKQRTLRALEVVLSTGTPLSVWLTRKPPAEESIEACRIGLTLPRPLLYDRISERVHLMIERGWIEEVEALLGKGYSPSLPAFQAIGYRELVEVIQGRDTLKRALDKIIRATRRYAKRQLTWLRKEQGIQWLEAGGGELNRAWLDKTLLGLDRECDDE